MNILYISKEVACYMIKKDLREVYPHLPVMPGDAEISVDRIKLHASEYKMKGGDVICFLKAKRKWCLKAY